MTRKRERIGEVPVWTSKRWTLAYIGLLGFFIIYSLRVDMSVAIVCMVTDKPDVDTNKTLGSYTNETTTKGTGGETCAASGSSDEEELGEFEWDKTRQSFILSAFFYGYIVTQIPGGWLAGKIGGRRVLGYSVLITSIATLLIPVSARFNYIVVIVLRAIMGIAQGVSFPAMHAMLGRWAPPYERTRLASVTYSGLNLGNIVTFTASGVLCAYGFDNGWASIFYIFGIAGFVWVAAWFFLVADSPETHPTISSIEKVYILENRGDSEDHEFQVPWLAILKSKAMFACLAAHFCNNWLHYTLLTGLPTFMKEVLKFNIKENGVLSSIPYIAMMLVVLVSGQVADYVRRHWLSTTLTRKIFQTVAFLGGGACIVAVGFVDCEHRIIAVVVLTIAVGFEGFCYCGYMVNHVDFAPRYAGVLYGITNFVATVPGIIAPLVTGALTPDKTQEQWRNVFYICGVFSLIGTVVFNIFATGELEPWAVDEEVKVVEHDLTEDKKKQRRHVEMERSYSIGKNNDGFEILEEDRIVMPL